MSDESIRSNLRHAGWSEAQVTEGFALVDKSAESMSTVAGAYNAANDFSSGLPADLSGVAVGLSGSSVEEKKPFSKKKMLKITALILIVFTLIGGSIGGYFLINPTLTKYLALKDLEKIESGRFQGRIVIKETSGGVDEKQEIGRAHV